MVDVILLAHGSPDPRAQSAALAFARAVETVHSEAHVHCAFLDHGPSLTEVVADIAAQGVGRAIVVPAFLSHAFHVRVDVPREVDAAQHSTGVELVLTMPIGTDGALLELLDDLLPDGPVTLAIAGTRDPDAHEQLLRVAERWSRRRASPVVLAHASMGSPTIPEALEELEAASGVRASVASFVLFPGVLPDRIAEAAGDRFVTDPLYLTPAAVSVVVERIRGAA